MKMRIYPISHKDFIDKTLTDSVNYCSSLTKFNVLLSSSVKKINSDIYIHLYMSLSHCELELCK